MKYDLNQMFFRSEDAKRARDQVMTEDDFYEDDFCGDETLDIILHREMRCLGLDTSDCNEVTRYFQKRFFGS